MICVFKCRGKDVPLCQFCDSCSHLCREKCVGLLRAKAIDRVNTPVVYSVQKEAPLARKFDICRQVTCRRTFTVEHPLQVYCSTPCGRKDRNRNYRIKADSVKGQSRTASDAKP
jgi:hypothetical protein